jgi:hypothetical protein
MNNEKLIKDWYSAIQKGIEYKNKYSSIKKWNDYRNMFRNSWKITDGAILNLIRPIVTSIINSSYYTEPKITITPPNNLRVREARILEKLLNLIIKRCGMKSAIRRAVRESALTGVGAIQIGFLDSYLSPYDKKGNLLDYRTGLSTTEFWLNPVLSNNIVTPAEYSRQEDFPYIAIFALRPLEDVKADEKYIASARKELKGNSVSYMGQTKESNIFLEKTNSQNDFCVLIHVHDKRSGKYYVFSENQLLLEESDKLQIDGMLPLECILLNEDSEHFWGIAIPQILDYTQQEVNTVKSYIMQMRKCNLIKFLYLKGTMTQDNINNLLSKDISDIGIGIPIESENISHIEQAVKEFQVQPNMLGLDRDLNNLLQQAREQSNVGVNQMGAYSGKHNVSAREASVVNQYMEQTVDIYKDIVSDVIIKILKRFAAYIFQNWQSSKVVQIIGQDGKATLEEFKGTDLQADYLIDVTVADYQPTNDNSRKENGLALASMLINDPLINSNAEMALNLRKFILQQFEWTHPDSASLLNVEETELPYNAQALQEGLMQPQEGFK